MSTLREMFNNNDVQALDAVLEYVSELRQRFTAQAQQSQQPAQPQYQQRSTQLAGNGGGQYQRQGNGQYQPRGNGGGAPPRNVAEPATDRQLKCLWVLHKQGVVADYDPSTITKSEAGRLISQAKGSSR